jgi:hypothetical protein
VDFVNFLYNKDFCICYCNIGFISSSGFFSSALVLPVLCFSGSFFQLSEKFLDWTINIHPRKTEISF